jgi:NTP-dependent ternary system trypsin peptidase co-occuring protein
VTTPNDQDPVGIGLAEAIGQVRTELEQAIKDGESSAVAFRAGTVELEFEVAFARTRGVQGGLQLSVLSFGAKGERSSTATHRVTVALTPVDRQGQDKLIGDVGRRDTGTK